MRRWGPRHPERHELVARIDELVAQVPGTDVELAAKLLTFELTNALIDDNPGVVVSIGQLVADAAHECRRKQAQ